MARQDEAWRVLLASRGKDTRQGSGRDTAETGAFFEDASSADALPMLVLLTHLLHSDAPGYSDAPGFLITPNLTNSGYT